VAGREGEREGGRKGGRERGRKGGREEGREGGRGGGLKLMPWFESNRKGGSVTAEKI
jgi:hypothetical protein